MNHSSSMDGTGNQKMLFNRPDLNGSGNLNSSLKMNSGNIAVTQGKSSVRSSAQRQLQEEKQKDPPATVVPSKGKVAKKRDPVSSSVLTKGKIIEGRPHGQEIRSATNAQVQRKKVGSSGDAQASEGHTLSGRGGFSGDNSEEYLHRMMLEQD